MKANEFIQEGAIGQYVAKSAAKLAAKPLAPHIVELFARYRDSLKQIAYVVSDPRNPRALDSALQRLIDLHNDLFKLKQGNEANFRIVREIERLAEDLQGMIKHFRVNSQQPGATGMFLQSIQRDLVPTLERRLLTLESLMKNEV